MFSSITIIHMLEIYENCIDGLIYLKTELKNIFQYVHIVHFNFFLS